MCREFESHQRLQRCCSSMVEQCLIFTSSVNFSELLGPYTGTIGTLAGAGRNRGVVFLRSELHFISQGDNRGYQREVEWPVT